jgi:hypothetical protein
LYKTASARGFGFEGIQAGVDNSEAWTIWIR